MDQNNFNQTPATVPGKGKATGALVCGIIAAVFCFLGTFAIVGTILAIVGLVLAISAKKDMAASGNFSAKGMATAGMVLSIIALAISLIVFVSCVICVASLGAAGAFSNYGF